MPTQDPIRLDPEDIEARGMLLAPNSDRVVSRVGALLSIYFLEGWRQDKRQSLVAILEDYLSRFADKLTHYQKRGLRKLSRWDGQGVPGAYRALADLGEAHEFSYHMQRFDPQQDDDPSLWRIMAFGFAKLNVTRRLSGLKVHFPPSYVFSDPDRFVELVGRWCSRLDAVHGSGGLGVLTVPGEEITRQPHHYRLLLRYPALEYDDMGSYWSETRRSGYDKPRSSNWLTILGSENVQTLGGAREIRSKLSPEMALEHYAHGVVIRAGLLPELGDGTTNTVPEAYRIAARIIKPIRYEGYAFSVIKVHDDLNGLDETLKWIRRFD
jgi:hypothetical protein